MTLAAAVGQLDGDGGAGARPAVDAQAAAVVLDDAVDDRHADAGAAVEERLERMEEVGALLLGHAAAGVDHLQAVAVAGRGRPTDAAGCRRPAWRAGSCAPGSRRSGSPGRDRRTGAPTAGSRSSSQAVAVGDLLAVLEQLEVLGEQARDVEARRSSARAGGRSAGTP